MMISDKVNLLYRALGRPGLGCLAAFAMMGATASLAGDDRPAPAPPGVIIEPPSPAPPRGTDEDEAGGDHGDPRGAGCPANQWPLELLVSLERSRMG